MVRKKNPAAQAPPACRPRSVAEALKMRRRWRALPFAGGTDLMAARRRGPGLIPDLPAPLLFLGHLKELKSLRREADSLVIGAACTLTELLEHPDVPPQLKAALAEMASPALRNVATLGGNICNASPAADTLPFLYAADAELELANADQSRRLPVAEFILGPGSTALGEDELLTAIIIPELSWDTWFYRKVGTRRANALSKLSFLGLASRDEAGRIADFRCAFGAVGPTVVRPAGLEEQVRGLSSGRIEALLPALRRECAAMLKPIDDQRSTAFYRASVAAALLVHFLQTLTAVEAPS
jgi:xanthine dehydrogenase FAD-binding subunit